MNGGARFRPFSGYQPLGAFWLILGSLLAPLWSTLGSFWHPFGSMLGPFGSILGPFGSTLRPFGSILDPFWAILHPWPLSWTVLGYIPGFWRRNPQKHSEIDPGIQFLTNCRLQTVFPRPGGGTIAAGNRIRPRAGGNRKALTLGTGCFLSALHLCTSPCTSPW